MMPKEISALIRYLPGKTDRSERSDSSKWLPVWMHLEDTAGIMSLLINNWLPEIIKNNIPDIERLGIFVGLTHDIGKMTPVFADHIQNSLYENKQRLENMGLTISTFSKNKPHAYMGMCILLNCSCPPGIAVTVGSHHGKPPSMTEYSDAEDDIADDLYGYFYDNNKTVWEQIHKEWLDYSLSKAGYSTVEDLPQLDKPAEMLMTGLLIMADWLASNTDYFPLIDIDQDPSELNRDFNEIWKMIGLPGPWTPCYSYLDEKRFSDMFGFSPNTVQKMLIDVISNSQNPGIFILEAPMGCGKTEAALAAAERFDSLHNCGGLFFGLPTQATANGIFVRLEKWAEARTNETDITNSIRLAHGMAELNEHYRDLFKNTDKDSLIEDDENGRLIVHSWFNGRKQALLANFVIGTVDQMLMASLAKKHVMLRHLGLAGKVVILDECHAYDAYMNRFMDRTLQWLGSYGTPVIILSATLPAKRRAELIKAYLDGKTPQSDKDWEDAIDYPLLTWTDGETVKQESAEIEESKKHPVYVYKLPVDGIIDCLKENLTDGGYAGVIVNTVRASQMLYVELRNAFPDADIRLFHSQFLAPARAEKEAKLLKLLGRDAPRKTGEKVIIVGTQVLEQSLDLDFDLLITELCPMDLLLQRIGRLHRHNEHDKDRPEKLKNAQCFVLPASDSARKIYAEWLLQTTEKLLQEEISIPDDISKLVQSAYNEPTDAVYSNTKVYNNYVDEIKNKKNKASLFQISDPAPDDLDIFEYNSILELWSRNAPDLKWDTEAEATVRDGIDSIQVLLMKRIDDHAEFVDSEEKEKIPLTNMINNSKLERKIATQLINLPYIFMIQVNDVINELSDRNQWENHLWQNSSWLKGKLVLFLDESCETDLIGYHLSYDHEKGLMYSKEKEC